MTDARRQASESAVIREVIRRAGHEIRNALSGVSVNLEVVRSRCSRDPGSADVLSFADRARSQIETATALTNGLLALMAAVVAAEGDGTAKSAVKAGDSVELTLNADPSAVLSDIQQLAGAVGVLAEQRGANVILRVLPEGQSHSKD